MWGSAAWINPSEPLVPAPSRPRPQADVRLRAGASTDEKSEESMAVRVPYVLFSENGVEPKNISDTSQKKYQLDYRG